MRTESVAGLSTAQAAELLEQCGPNSLPTQRRTTWVAALARQLTDTVIVVLLVAMVLTLLMGDYPDCAVIAAVIVLNSVLSASQEVRSAQALEALAALTAPRAVVLRDGAPTEVAAADVVPGDVVLLTAGDIVAADGTLLTAEALQLDESTLTGESLPVDRGPGEPVAGATVVVRGRGVARIDRTGAHTEIGRIGRGLQDSNVVLSPLQRQLARLGRLLALIVAVAAVTVAILVALAGKGIDYSITVAISLAVAAIPESLPAVVALSLALAARRMVAAGVLVRRLAAVEALGSVTVLGTDKTGTLTEGTLSVVRTWTPSPGEPADRRLLEASVLCNDASDSAAGTHDDPVDAALVAHAAGCGIDVAAVRRRQPRIGEEPFDAARARMVTEHRVAGTVRDISKGSPEAIAALCGPSREADDVTAAASEAGGRVLALADRTATGPWERLGLVVFADRPRPEAADVVAAFHRAGVRPVMITGDHPGTARAIARAVGIDDAERSVYARVTPARKTEIVRDLQRSGELVAMTGDGVNDAAALRAADVGVAMGRRGTEVARQAADLVLTKDDLGAMVTAIAEGRRAYDNLRRFLHYALSGGLAEILVMLAGPFLGLPVPLGPGQILWVNLLTHGLPGVAMGNEPAQSDVLTRKPRPPRQALVDAVIGRRVAVLGACVAVVCLGAALWAKHAERPWQAYAFVTLGLAQLLAALAMRPSWRRANPMLVGAVALNVALIVLAVRWGPLESLLRTDQLGPADLLRCLLAAAPAAVVAFLQTHRIRPEAEGAAGPSTLGEGREL